MITAIIRNKDNTLVLDFPCDICNAYSRSACRRLYDINGNVMPYNQQIQRL